MKNLCKILLFYNIFLVMDNALYYDVRERFKPEAVRKQYLSEHGVIATELRISEDEVKKILEE